MNARSLRRGYSARVRRASRALFESIEPRLLLANVVVNTLADETNNPATTSLREAVAKANPGDTIVFQSGLSGQITLGGSQILINKNLQIDGPNTATPSITVSGNNASRVFDTSSGVILRIDDLRIQEGRADSGAGIRNNGGQLTLANVQFNVNTAVGRDGNDTDANGGDALGGAIYSTGNLTITGGAITNNTAQGGEGGFSETATTTTYGAGGNAFGGGIYCTSETSIDGTRFTNNTALGGHGVVFTVGGRGGDAYGGAIAAKGRIIITGATLNINHATGGSAGDGDFDSNNGGEAFGGAIWAHGSEVTLGIGSSTLDGNTATGGGGGSVSELLVVYGGGSASGGAISADSTNLSIGSSTLTNNSASGGFGGGGASGGAVSSGFNSLSVTNSLFASNHAVGSESLMDQDRGSSASGGAISTGSILNITGSTFSRNTVVGGKGANADASRGRQIPAAPGGLASGGAINVGTVIVDGPPPNPKITSSTFFGNSAQGGEGGWGYDDVTWPAGGGGDARGGGIYASDKLDLTASTIAGNSVVAGLKGTQGGGSATNGQAKGGGVAVVGTKTVNIANTIIATNTGPGDVSGVVNSLGFNLIGKNNGSGGWIARDKTGNAATPLDPKLGALTNNGGPTPTMLPQTGSPAIDAGKAFGLTRDQRGLPRPADLGPADASGGDGSDIGAVEVQPAVPIQFPFTEINIGDNLIYIQAEDFDNGGEGVAYHDLDAANRGARYRTTGVDIDQATTTGDGFVVGWTKAGEWLEYTVNVQTAGTYRIDFGLTSNGAGGKFHLEVDGINKTGSLTVPNTGGWYTDPAEVSKTGVQMAAGKHVLRLAMESNGATGSVGNFNYFRVTKTAATTTTTINTDTAAHVRDGGFANTNFGNAVKLEVKKSTSGYNREAYLKFNLASVASISNAKLRIFGNLDVAGSIALGVYGSSNTGWSESAITWNNRNPAATGATAIATATISGTTAKWYELDVTSYLKGEKLAGHNTVTLVLKSSTNTTALATFAADGAANAPQLLVTT